MHVAHEIMHPVELLSTKLKDKGEKCTASYVVKFVIFM